MIKDVIAQGSKVHLQHTAMSVDDLARTYQPILWNGTNGQHPAPVAVWYLAVNRVNTIVIVYYPTWEDEQHPIRIIDAFYKFFRKIYYGSYQDMEYIEVHVDIGTGKIEKVLFDTAHVLSETLAIFRHCPVVARRENSDYHITICRGYKETAVNKQKQEQQSDWFDGTHPVLTVSTWNHLYKVGRQPHADERVSFPLRFLDAKTFTDLRVALRSHGEIQP